MLSGVDEVPEAHSDSNDEDEEDDVDDDEPWVSNSHAHLKIFKAPGHTHCILIRAVKLKALFIIIIGSWW